MNKSKKPGKLMYLAIGILIPVFLLSGCRQSPTLEQIIYQQKTEDVDQNNDINNNDKNNSQKDEDLFGKAKDKDSKTQRERERTNAVEGKSNSDSTNTTKLKNDSNSDNNSQGSKQDNQNGDSNNVKDKNSNQNNNNSDDQNNGGKAQENPGTGGSGREVVDANGENVEVPENVDTVTAVGEAAEIVQMLGGSGRLVGSSESYTDNSLARAVFSDEGFSKTAKWWSQDGSTGGVKNFSALLAAKPNVCFEISGQQTFTNAQIAALKKNNISYVVLPKLNTSKGIKQAVTIVGNVLGNRSANGGTNAVSMASDYISWFGGIIKQTEGRGTGRVVHNSIDYDNDRTADGVKYLESSNTGKYSLFISNWDSSADYKVYNSNCVTLSGKGAAVAASGYSSSPLSYYMSVGGVINMPAAVEDYGVQKYWYVNSLLRGNYQVSINGNYTSYQAGSDNGPYLTRLDSNNVDNLGTANYPAVIVADSSIREEILNSPLWKVYGEVSDSSGVRAIGFKGDDGLTVPTAIRGKYQIYVNPSGVGSWTDGSVESPLEAVWISCKFNNGYSMDEVQSKVRDFYHVFYHYDLSDEQVNKILNESVNP